jgi:hypothetical protein
MTDVEQLLPTALAELSGRAPHDNDLAGTVRAGLRRRRVRIAGPVAAVLAVAVVIGAVVVGAVVVGGGRFGPSTAREANVAAAPSACRPLNTGPLPEWARAGFSDPSGNPHTVGAKGTILAVVFASPLRSPTEPDAGNKILWVAKQTPTAGEVLKIRATLEGSTRQTTVDLGTAPGPSIVEMPVPGCWHLDLTWGSHQDSVDLRWE